MFILCYVFVEVFLRCNKVIERLKKDIEKEREDLKIKSLSWFKKNGF